MDCSLPDFSVHGILQARILEWVALSFSRGSSRPGDWTQASHAAGRFFTNWATREAPWIRSSLMICKVLGVCHLLGASWKNADAFPRPLYPSPAYSLTFQLKSLMKSMWLGSILPHCKISHHWYFLCWSFDNCEFSLCLLAVCLHFLNSQLDCKLCENRGHVTQFLP